MIKVLNKKIESEEFISLHKISEKAFTRKCTLTFPILFLFIVNLLKGSIQKELNLFFKTKNRSFLPTTYVTKGAFTKARKKLSFKAFIELKNELSTHFEKGFPVKTWNGFRLIGIDGSTLKLPSVNEILDHFGTQSHENANSCPMARISQSFDVLNQLTLDASIAPIKTSEHALAIEHITKAPEKSLFLLDRGYPAIWLFSLIESQDHHYCSRVKTTWSRQVIDFFDSGDKEATVEIKPHHSSYSQFRKIELPRTPIKVRLIRIELESSETEILITSLLDCDRFPHHLFKDLYFMRWGIEEDYKCLKHRIEVENFSGKTVESVYQDFHAKVFAKNLTSVIANSTDQMIQKKTMGRKYHYKINFTMALAEMKQILILLFREAYPETIIKEFQVLLCDTAEPIRKDRSFKRKQNPKSRKKYYYGYKSPG